MCDPFFISDKLTDCFGSRRDTPSDLIALPFLPTFLRASNAAVGKLALAAAIRAEGTFGVTDIMRAVVYHESEEVRF